MASNDAESRPEPPNTGPVAFLERIVRLPAQNDQTPWRVAYMLVLAVALAFTPMPFQVIGFIALLALALSYGRIRKS